MGHFQKVCSTCKETFVTNEDSQIHCGACMYKENFERAKMKIRGEEKVFSGILSSKQPRLDLITYNFLCDLAARCELGIERKKEKAWNASTVNSNWGCLSDLDLAIERSQHVANHAFKMIEKLRSIQSMKGDISKTDMEIVLEDNDASAIGWGAMYLCEVIRKLKGE